MIISLFKMLTFLLFLSSIVKANGLGSVLSLEYRQMRFGSTWKNAQRYCRNHYTDLAFFYNESQAKSIHLKEYLAWIGLHRHTVYKHWVWTDLSRRPVKWGKERNEDEECAAIGYHDHDKIWVYSRKCEEKLFLACQTGQRSTTFIQDMKNWSQAKKYCNNLHNGLARFYVSDMSIFSQENFPIWIGLHRTDGSWKWSSGLNGDKNWNLNEPSDGNDCVTISSLKNELATENCNSWLPFLCMKDNMVLVKVKKTWEEAFEYCRGLRLSLNSDLRFDLLSVQPGDEHNTVIHKVMEADTEEVWTGLRLLGDECLWINGADMLYTDLLQCPIQGRRCGALSKNDTGTVEARDCSERKNFLCYSYYPLMSPRSSESQGNSTANIP